MFQIIALRPFFNQKTKKEQIKHQYISQTDNINDILVNPKLSLIPENERYNVYFTVQENTPPTKFGDHYKNLRRFKTQSIIPFDIDNIDPTKIDDYVTLFLNTLKLDRSKTSVLFSGNGLQFFVLLPKAFEVTEFEDRKQQYDKIALKLQRQLLDHDLPGNVDTSVWCVARLMRFPNTKNIKPHKGEKQAYLITQNLFPQDFNWEELSEIQKLDHTQVFVEFTTQKKVAVDDEYILEQCKFLNWLYTKPVEAHEPHFYAALSITGHFTHSQNVNLTIRDKFLQYSPKSQVGSYNDLEVHEKTQQAVTSSAPRTCKNINAVWSKCSTCPHFNAIKSPIQLKSDFFIATKDTGFHLWQKGKAVPQYQDLYKYFYQLHKPVLLGNSDILYVYNGKFYKIMEEAFLKNFAEVHFNPKPLTPNVSEFVNTVKRNNVIDPIHFNPPNNYINLQNGILNLDTKELIPHNPKFYFKYVLPFDYDPTATAPTFQKFLNDITMGRKDLQDVLLEMAGYAISGASYWLHKIFILVGEGRNGKSTFLNVLAKVAGHENVSFASFDDLYDINMRQTLEGKLFNMTEELANKDLKDTSMLKQITGQGTMAVKLMYHQPYYIVNRAKLIVATNEIPNFNDSSLGLAKRLCIIPFDRTFKDSEQDKFILDKLYKELPGIFNLFLTGLDRLNKQQNLTRSQAIEDAVEDQIVSANIVRQWLDDSPHIVVHPLNGKCHFAKSRDLYNDFKDWVIGISSYHYNNWTEDHFFKKMKLSISEGSLRYARIKKDGKAVRGYYDVEILKKD